MSRSLMAPPRAWSPGSRTPLVRSKYPKWVPLYLRLDDGRRARLLILVRDGTAHRPFGQQHPPARLGRARRTHQDLPRSTRQKPAPPNATASPATTTAPCASWPKSTPPPRPTQTTRPTRENQRRPTHPERKPHPRRPGPVATRRDSARRGTATSKPSPARPVSTAPPSTAAGPTGTCASNSSNGFSSYDTTDAPDPKTTQIERLKADVDKLKTRLAQANTIIDQLADFRTQALARLAAQHEEILRLRAAGNPTAKVTRLPVLPQKVVGPC